MNFKRYIFLVLILTGCANWGIKKQPLVQGGFPTWETPIVVDSISPFYEGTKAAINFMNASIGCDVFIMFDSNVHPFSNLNLNYLPTIPNIASVKLKFHRIGNKKILDGSLYLKKFMSFGDQFWVISHELGHVLGLLHDSYGLMKPRFRLESNLTENPTGFPRMNDGDRRILHKMYCAN